MTIFPDGRCRTRVLCLLPLVAALAGCQGLARTDGGGDQAPPGSLAASPPSLSFGNVIVGESKSLNASLKATGAPVNISSVTTNNAEFAVSGISLPASLDAGQSRSFTVTFTPQVSGVASATLRFASDASNSPALQSQDGTGTQPPEHSVDLSWQASQSDGVVGYNVYRKTSGSYARINTALEASTTYTDGIVDAGATYFYVVTAVDQNGVESDSSEKVKAVIPTP